MTATRRRLTAILAADVVGYTRLMGADEAGTHERLQAYLRELVDPKIREHQGFLVKSTGDGLLAEFPNVVDAVHCAVEIQRQMAERNAAIPAERRIEFRMGINVGDVIAEPDDIFGIGVNIAARLEALAEPGGICVSRVVRDQVRGRLDYTFEDMGEQQVKNIARPVRAYRVDLAAAPEPPTAKPPSLSISELMEARIRGRGQVKRSGREFADYRLAPVQCPNGHNYDGRRHTHCPYCPVPEIQGTGAPSRPGMPQTEPASPRGTGAPIRRGESADRSGTPGVTAGIFQKHTGIDPVVGWLVCVKGVNEGRDYRLHSDLNKLGRAPNMDVCIEGDDAISRVDHCRIALSPRSKTFSIVPGETRNLSYLNGENVLSETRLKAYDRLDLGDSSFIFIPLELNWGASAKSGSAPWLADKAPQAGRSDRVALAYRRAGRLLAPRIWSFIAKAIGEFFPGKTSPLPDNQEVATAMAVAVASPASPSAEQPLQDLVDVSAFAPEGGVAGAEVLVQIFLHRLDDAAIAEEGARAADPDAIRRGVATLVAEIARGKRVDILLEGRDTTIDEPLQSIIWRGEPCAAQFSVTLPETTADRSCNLRVRILLDEVPIGSLRFALKMTATTPVDPRSIGIRGDTAARYHRAFLSYATPDRPEVLKRAQTLRAAHIEFFQDFLSIEPGERWERQLYKEIDLCDLFLLFWSNNAARSEWVLREAGLAVARQNASPDEEPDITPIILEGPPVPQPIPDFLKHLQFNDYLAYLIGATERERRATDLPQ
jgi:class 3 adenylate cyclase